MTAHIAPTDLHVLDAEPRVQDLRLAEALDFSQPIDIRKLVRRNAEELAKYGEVFATVAKTFPTGGRPGEEFWLNEAQSVLICMFSRTDKAAEVRREIIEVFIAWRRGHDRAALPGPIASTADTIDGQPLALLGVKLGMVRESRLIHGPERARLLWGRLGLPAVPEGAEALVASAGECLGHILAAKLGAIPLHRALSAALNDDAEADGLLREHGIRVITIGEEGFIVANGHAGMRQVLHGTPWIDNWPAVLRRYPGARKVGPTKFSTITAHRGVFIPAEALDDFASLTERA